LINTLIQQAETINPIPFSAAQQYNDNKDKHPISKLRKTTFKTCASPWFQNAVNRAQWPVPFIRLIRATFYLVKEHGSMIMK